MVSIRQTVRRQVVGYRSVFRTLDLVRGLSVDEVSYAYRGGWTLGPVSASYPVGISALVGPNGSGKTTLLRLLAGVARPHSGSLKVGGTRVRGIRDREQYRSRVSYLPQSIQWPGRWRISDFLEYVSGMYRVKDVGVAVATALRSTNTTQLRDRRFAELSGGQRQRVFLAACLVPSPAVLILDEPTVGLDPSERIAFRRHLVDAAQDRCVILSTHLMDDVSLAADSVHIVADGQLRWVGTVSALEAEAESRRGSGISAAEDGYLRVIGAEPS